MLAPPTRKVERSREETFSAVSLRSGLLRLCRLLPHDDLTALRGTLRMDPRLAGIRDATLEAFPRAGPVGRAARGRRRRPRSGLRRAGPVSAVDDPHRRAGGGIRRPPATPSPCGRPMLMARAHQIAEGDASVPDDEVGELTERLGKLLGCRRRVA